MDDMLEPEGAEVGQVRTDPPKPPIPARSAMKQTRRARLPPRRQKVPENQCADKDHLTFRYLDVLLILCMLVS